jgi:hypothetical protein
LFHGASFISAHFPERRALNKIKFAFYKSTKQIKNQYNFSKNVNKRNRRRQHECCRLRAAWINVEKGEYREFQIKGLAGA